MKRLNSRLETGKEKVSGLEDRAEDIRGWHREIDSVKMRSGQEEMMRRSSVKEGRIRRMGGAMFEEIMADSILKLMKNMHPSPGSFLAQTRYVVLGQPTLLHTRAPPPAFPGG